jgi:hypothetical protein
MKLKTTLIAAATLAVGVIASQAAVYSQNIVGYANVATPNGGTYLLNVPFAVGVSNGANEIWPLVGGSPSIPDGSELLIWNGGGYDTYFSDSGSSSLWDDASQSPIANSPLLPVGKGFFILPAGNLTNTFTGAIPVAVGTTNSTVLPNGGTYLLGAAVPYAGAITNGSSSGGGLALSSLNGLPDGSELLIWNGGGYDTYFSDSGSSSLWDDASQSPISTPPSIGVGQGFFVLPAGNFTWKVGL